MHKKHVIAEDGQVPRMPHLQKMSSRYHAQEDARQIYSGWVSTNRGYSAPKDLRLIRKKESRHV